MKIATKILLFALLSFGLTACGALGGGGEKFEGDWEFTNSQGGLTCDDGTQAPINDQDADRVTITADGGDITYDDGDCTYSFSVDGNVATVEAGSSCTQTTQGIEVELKMTSWTLTLSGDDDQLTSSGQGTAELSRNGAAADCQVQINSSLKKIGD